MSTLSRRALWIGALLGIAVVAVVLYFRTSGHADVPDGGAQAAVAPDAPSVAVMPVMRRNLTQTMKLTSELNPYEVVKLYAKEAGYLRDIDVDYGSRVKAGETLATLELPEQKADLNKSDAAYGLAKVDYDRVASVNRQEPGLIAQADVDKAKADYLMAQDQRERASVVEGYGVIAAPFDGVVTKRYVDPGALIEQGTTSSSAMPIVEVANTYRLRLVVETPESIVPLVRIGMPVSVRISATGETIADRVARFSYDLHEDTRTMHTEIDIDNADLHIKPGMYASATFLLASRPNAISVPIQAISTDGSSDVWIVDDADTLQRRHVTLGLRTPAYAEVKAGLTVGERVFVGDRTSYAIGTKVVPKFVAAARA
ncbi:MAG: efflux RND transporter periplasmic adaptor subunit [Candidatus Eremiobacteraeota bacterium]|nr:efflux RND transporter periplasmic adaptor subunit [Candidatus Eremiobacteraeota bacterium]